MYKINLNGLLNGDIAYVYNSVIFRVQATVEESISIIKESFDNDVTPYFALVICLWGKLIYSDFHMFFKHTLLS